MNVTGRALLLAWILSIGVHGLIFLGMLALVFPFSDRPDPSLPLSHVDIVGSVAASPYTPAQVPNPTRPIPTPKTSGLRLTPKAFAPLSAMTQAKKTDLSIIGIGAGGGDFARYGLSVGSVPGPEFFGLGRSARNARTVVYVVDRSGSMLDTFIHVKDELRRSISKLRRSQKFHVIFFNAGPPLENPPGRPVSAINAHKEQFFTFMERVVPRGQTHPEAALRRAIGLEPDLIYLLSDGDSFPSGLLHHLDEWNRDRRVRIYTIAYLSHMGRAVLEQIAREHNGEFTFVSEHDLP